MNPRRLFAAVCGVYAAFLALELGPVLFDPSRTTSDARQQIYPLHDVLEPGVFEGDLVTEAMKAALPPLHLALSRAMTRVTRSPILAGRWVMLLQLAATLVFAFLLVRRLAGAAPAWFSVAWILHTRPFLTRMVSGLPRGWAPAILLACLHLCVAGRHRAVIATILLGIVLNPPAALLAAAGYGLFLLWSVARPASRAAFTRPLRQFLLAAPLLVGVAWATTRQPASIGSMVGLDAARAIPQFHRPGGRFPYVPLQPAWMEISSLGMQAFVDETSPRALRAGHRTSVYCAILVAAGLGLALAVQARTGRSLLPPELAAYLAAVFLVYFAARLFAFHLYVPDRYLRYPLNLFHIVALPVVVWRAGLRASTARYSAFALAALGAAIVWAGGSGLGAGFNLRQRNAEADPFYTWVREATPRRASFAGHPTTLDGLPLFGHRRALITTETAHPFFDRYRAEAGRRLEIALRAHYATSPRSFLEELGAEPVDYFVFRSEDFSPSRLLRADYDQPLGGLVGRLARRPPDAYFANRLREFEGTPVIAFSGDGYTVVDVAALRALPPRQ